MLQSLLAQRFKLAVHRAQKEQTVLALTVAKGGPKLVETPADAPLPPRSGFTRTFGPDGSMRMDIKKMSMDGLADLLSRFMDRAIVDQTGLKSAYDLAIDFSPEDLQVGSKAAGVVSPGGDTSGPSSISTSLQTLGLKLESRKLPIDAIVVDHLEKLPTAN